jgi:cholesterol transport system auxiliary component
MKTFRILAVCVAAASLCACSALQPKASAPPAFYVLEAALPSGAPLGPVSTAQAVSTLVISPVRAASGFDSQRIIYVREPHKLEYFAHSEWIDTPARMLGPLLVASITRTGAFKAVVMTPGAAGGELRLDTEIVRLQQDFQTRPSRVHFTLRAYLVDEKTRKVLAWREFDGEAAATSDDPYAGVVAANRVVQTVLQEVSQFLAQRPNGT